MPTVSVIVPVYKVEPYLHRCVDSILEQTFSDFELILVDDGSPDNCGAICDEYAAKDSRVHVIHQQNGGLSAARNTGIERALANGSQWLAFVDSDDEISPYYLSRMYEAAMEHHAELCVCDFRTIYPDGKQHTDEPGIPARIAGGRELLEEKGFLGNWHIVIACNKLYRAELFVSLRFPVGYVHEDEAVIHRVLGAAPKVVCIPDQLYYYYQRTNSITGSGRSVKSTDYLTAMADRIRYARENRLPNCASSAVWGYLWFLLEIALPLLVRAEKGSPYIKRSARATRAVLPALLRSKSRSRREKLRIVLFGFFPRAYLAHARRNLKK